MTTKRVLTALILALLTAPMPAAAQQEETYDYWKFQREMVRYGQQAIFMCNGLFTSNRSVENVFAQELAFHRHHRVRLRQVALFPKDAREPLRRHVLEPFGDEAVHYALSLASRRSRSMPDTRAASRSYQAAISCSPRPSPMSIMSVAVRVCIAVSSPRW